MKFPAFTDDIVKNGWNVFGTEIWQGGKLIHAWGDTEKKRHPIYSAAKTITSIAVGMAVDEGKMDVHRSVLEYLPVSAVRKMTDKQREIYGKITVQRLLTMSVTGYPFRPEGESWLDAALGYEIDAEKRVFDYSNVSAYLAGAAAAEAVHENPYEYLERKLFEPLGIEHPPYMTCPDGYFIWKYRDGFSINGKWGQKCYVLPEKGMMVTYLSHIEEKCPGLRESMERNLLEVEPADY